VLRKPQRGEALVERLGERVDLSGTVVVGSLRRTFRSVTAAAGAYGVRTFADPDSLVLTGEFKHHDALRLLKRGVTAVQLGHYESERPVLGVLRALLRKAHRGVKATIARSDRAPFLPLTAR
jgi:putative NIF3 family GTP cyclohydrolase 1 type 2